VVSISMVDEEWWCKGVASLGVYRITRLLIENNRRTQIKLKREGEKGERRRKRSKKERRKSQEVEEDKMEIVVHFLFINSG
jgi:hypothetical protein